MDHAKLFHVLVIGGALLGTACVTEAPGADGGGATEDAQGEADAGAPGGDAAPTECGFCPNEVCCEPDGMGGSRTRAGMMCCWSTSC